MNDGEFAAVAAAAVLLACLFAVTTPTAGALVGRLTIVAAVVTIAAVAADIRHR